MDPKDLIDRGFFDQVDLLRAPAPVDAGADRFGRYVVLDLVGQGGTATVHRAIDVLLNREVALKRLKVESGAVVTRFLREAELMARCSHPGIVPIFDLGRVGDSVYLTMPLVRGSTLQALIQRQRPGPREAARILREAALAVQAAHDAGVVHRDLKPSNILVEDGGRAMVADFGLGRAEDPGPQDARDTATGAFMGTLLYTSPEQARGDWKNVGARSDVYSLGATLYETLTGKPPLEGDSSVEILQRILQDDPVPPSRRMAGVPWELEVICLRALEKEPERRYPSMKALADDLDRYLRGEPVLARRASLLYRVRRRLLRNRAAAATAAIGLAGLLVLTAVLVAGRLREGAMAGRLREMAQRMRTLVDARVESFEMAQFLPPHDLRPAREDLRRAEAELEAMRREEPTFHEALIQAARIRRHLGDLPKALESVEAGLAGLGRDAKGSDLLERALVHLAAWQEESDAASILASSDRRAAVEPLQRRLALAGEDLEEAARRGLPESRREWTRYYEAVIAFAKNARLVALERCDAVLKAPGVEARVAAETWKLRARIGLSLGDYDVAAADFAKAAELKRSDPRAWSGAASARASWAHVAKRLQGPEAKEAVELGMREAETGLVIDPESPEAWRTRGFLSLTLGLLRAGGREDPSAQYAAALKDLDRAVFWQQRDPAALNLRGLACWHASRLAPARGEDPSPLLDRALADFSTCVDILPAYANGWGNRAKVRADRARLALSRGGNPGEDLALAVEDAGKAVAKAPGSPVFLSGRGSAYLETARWRSSSGGDPARDFELAIADFEAAAKAEPRDEALPILLGSAFNLRARHLTARGGDPEPDREKALAAFDRALEIVPAHADAFASRGMVWLDRFFANERPSPAAAERALKEFDAALKLNPSQSSALGGRGLLRGLRKDWKGSVGDLREALRLNPGLGDLYRQALKLAEEKLTSEGY